MLTSWLIAEISLWSFGLPPPVGLAIVVLLGYWVTWRLRVQREAINNARHDLNRIKGIVKELEAIARGSRIRLTRHHADILKFKHRIERLGESSNGLVGREVCDEADRLSRAIIPLASEIAQTYYEIRRQQNMLMQISETRIDALTGVCNRHALDDDLAAMLARWALNEKKFSLVMFDIDHFKKMNDEKGHLHGDRVLQQVAHQLSMGVGETDIVTRYGGEEFVVLLPEDEIETARLVADRLRRLIAEKLGITLSGGVAEVRPGDDVILLLSRADDALYGAKQAGRNRVCWHSGNGVEHHPVGGNR